MPSREIGLLLTFLFCFIVFIILPQTQMPANPVPHVYLRCHSCCENAWLGDWLNMYLRIFCSFSMIFSFFLFTLGIEYPLLFIVVLVPTLSLLAGDIQASGSGRTRRDAAARAMQGWHSLRFLGNGEVSSPIVKVCWNHVEHFSVSFT